MYAFAVSQLTYLHSRRVARNPPPAKLRDPPALHASVGELFLQMALRPDEA